MRILVAVPPGAEKPPTLPPAAKSLAGDDQRHRIVRHGLTDIARSFRSGTEFLRQSAISGRAAPSDLPRRGINTLEKWVLLAEVELEPGKICLLTLEIVLCSGDRLSHLGRGRARFGAGRPTR